MKWVMAAICATSNSSITRLSLNLARSDCQTPAEFCPPHKASKAVGLIKRACQTGPEMAFQDSLALERELQQQLFQSSDAKEGIAAHVEKRVAKFTAQ